MPSLRTLQRISTAALLLAVAFSCGGDSPTGPAGPGPGETFTLSGVITSESTSENLSGARVEVVDGRHAGKFDDTDGNGRYSIPGLDGGLSVRASKDGYEQSPSKGVTMTSNQTLDITLRDYEGGARGKVTDIISGASLGGIEVSIPEQGSVETSGNGNFTLSVSQAGTYPMSLAGGGYFERETYVAVSSFADVDLTLIPDGMGFDLSFFDHVFRGNGADPTSRWTDEPTFEIWTREFRCEGGGADEACQRLVATDANVPAVFINNAESVLASDLRALTGGFVRGNQVRRRNHDPGTVVTAGQMFSPDVVVIALVRNSRTSKSWAGWQTTGNQAIYSGRVQINTRHEDLRCIMSHEIAHTLGYHHPDGQYSVPKPSVMRCDGPTSDDRLHGRILYLRPPGSRSPDKDPSWFTATTAFAAAMRGPVGGLRTHEAYCGH